MTSSGNEQVIKTVAKKLKYYIDVKRLEDGFDLSGAHSPVLDHPPMKARPTLLYGGLHDRPLKHYFSSHDVRVNLTQMRNRPYSAAPHERTVKHRLKKYMSKYEFQLNGPDLPPVSEGKKRPKTARKSKNSKHTLPEYYYIYTANTKNLRPEVTSHHVPFKSPKKKPIKGGWPVLRTVPSQNVSRGEAERLVNAATKLLIATESVEQNGRPVSGKQTAPRPFETSVDGFPGIDEEESRLLSKSGQPSKTDGKRPATAKYTWDIHGRRVPHEQAKAYDDSYVGRNPKSTRRPYSSHPSSRPTSKRVYRHRSPTPSDSASTSLHSYTHSTSTSDVNMERLPPASRRKKKSGSRQSLDSDRSRERDERPSSARYHSQTIINVPELKVNEDVRVQETTQTTGEQDEIGIQTETRLIQEYEPEEDEVKQGPWSEYQVYVRTGNNIGASTRADIKLTLYGELGRTKEITLGESKSNKVAFQKGKEDLFMIAAHHVGKLRKIKIGHDRTELSNAWFLDSVTVSDMHGKRIYEFPCNQWLSEHDADRRTYRTLPTHRDRAFVDALQSPRASQIKASARHETSEDDSYPVVVKHDKNSIKANQSKSGGRGRKKKTKDDSEYSTDLDSESDPDEAAVVSLKEKTGSSKGSKGAKGKPKAKSKQPVKPESRTGTGPTFTFRSKDGKKSATRRQGEKVGEEEEDGKKKGQEEYLAGYKAAITAVSSESRQKEEEEREMEKKMLRGESVHDAAKRGHLDRLKELLQHFPEMKDSKDESGWTPLHHASSNGHIDVVKWLTTSGVDLNIETRTGYTPIHVAAMNGHVNAMMVLSAMGAAITCRTVDQQTPLHLAARGGFLECVKWLVANRARIDTEDSFKRTPIDMSEEYQQDSVTDFLRVCQKELKNPHSSFSQMQGGQSSNKEANWKDDKASNTSHSAAAGSDDDSSVSVKQTNAPELKEKRRMYEEQHHKMEETGMSFLDSIRQEVD